MSVYDINGNKIVTENSSGSDTTMKTKKVPWDTVIHRGWVAGATENTLPAFYLTKENGYDWGECDIRFSSDGVPVLAHNTTIVSEDGTTTLTVASSTVEELKSIVLKTHETYGEIRMPTLAELLDMARLINLGILIDVKAGSTSNMTTLAKVVLSSGWAEQVVYMPMNTANAEAIQKVDRNASFDFVSSVSTVDGLPDLAPYQALLTGANTVGFDLNSPTTDANGGMDTAIFDAVRSAGLSISFWNIRTSSYITYMDAGPLRITKQNSADKTDLDQMYLDQKTFW